VPDEPDRLLQILRETCRSEVRSDQPDLPLRQLAILLVIYQTDDLQTGRGLAKHLNASKPAITRALDHLEDLDLAYRVIDDRDRRSVLVHRTLHGTAMMQRLGVTMTAATARVGRASSGSAAAD
jgi:DNA-binding MarR family transcriptional regulator